MRIRCALLCLFLGWPLAGWGEDQVTSTNPADTNLVVPRSDGRGGQSAGDVSNVSEYLEEKFQIPARTVPETPPGSNDLAAVDGRIYRNVQVWKAEPDGVTFRHDEGLTKLAFPLLPEDWQKKYGYNPEAAAAYQRVLADAFKEAERNQQMLREQINAARTTPAAEESQ